MLRHSNKMAPYSTPLLSYAIFQYYTELTGERLAAELTRILNLIELAHSKQSAMNITRSAAGMDI